MRSLKRVTFIAGVSVLLLGILAFVLENQQAVPLSFLGWSLPPVPVSFAVVVALLLGMLIGPGVAWLYVRKARRV